MNTSILCQAGIALIAAGLLYPQVSSADSTHYIPPKPGSYQAIMATKMPGVFGPHLPAADIPSKYVAPAPGSVQAILSVKDPSHYGPHLAAADVPSSYVAPVPGSALALLSVKNPQRYRELAKK